jgi:hypothetical protein
MVQEQAGVVEKSLGKDREVCLVHEGMSNKKKRPSL